MIYLCLWVYLMLGVATYCFLAYWARDSQPQRDWWRNWTEIKLVVFVVALWPVILGLVWLVDNVRDVR